MSFGGGRLSAGETRALRYALCQGRRADRGGGGLSRYPSRDIPAKDLQPTGTGRKIDAGKGLVVTAADLSGTRASFAGRGSQISMAAMGDTGHAKAAESSRRSRPTRR